MGAVTALVGVGFFALPAGIIGSGFIEVSMEENRRNSARGGGGSGGSMRAESSGSLIRPVQSEGSLSSSTADELAVLQQAAAALRRQEVSLALCLIDERVAALQRR